MRVHSAVIVRRMVGMYHRYRGIVHMHHGDRLDFVGQARKRRPERKRNRRSKNAKQIGQDDDTSRPHPP
jgi:hypothetical protein